MDPLSRLRRQLQAAARLGPIPGGGDPALGRLPDHDSASGNPSGSVTGWGLNLNGWLNTFGKDRIVGQLVYGHAIASYMNDGGVDIAPNANLQAEAVPSLGGFVYYDHYWNDS